MDCYLQEKIENLQSLLVVNRVKILKGLIDKDMCVCKMVEDLGMKHNLLSHHLKTLLDMGYLTNTRKGQHIIYSLVKDKRSEVKNLLNFIKR